MVVAKGTNGIEPEMGSWRLCALKYNTDTIIDLVIKEWIISNWTVFDPISQPLFLVTTIILEYLVNKVQKLSLHYSYYIRIFLTFTVLIHNY